MDESGSSVTLLNRVESHGPKFPWFLEKLIFLLTILGALLLGQWMWVESGWETFILWPMTICGLPLFAMLSAESLSRVVQAFHIRRVK